MQQHDRPLVVTGLEALSAMRMGVNYYHTITCRLFTVVVRPLSISEQLKVAAESKARVMALPKDMQNEMTLETEIAKQTLVLASTSDIDMNDPKLTDYLLSRMTVAEVMFLFREYNRFIESIDPSLSELPDDRIKQLVAEVKKSPELLTGLSRWELLNLARYFMTSVD